MSGFGWCVRPHPLDTDPLSSPPETICWPPVSPAVCRSASSLPNPGPTAICISSISSSAARCGARPYVRYVDDVALFSSNDKAQLWDWKQAIVKRLQSLRLTIHMESAQVQPVTSGIPWLGFVVYPTHRRVKSRKVVEVTRRLGDRFTRWQEGLISFGEFDARVQGWINHVRYADTWGLRDHVLSRLA